MGEEQTRPFWIGLNDDVIENLFVWSYGQPLERAFWDTNTMNDVTKNCVSVNKNGRWTVSDCSETKMVICQQKVPGK